MEKSQSKKTAMVKRPARSLFLDLGKKFMDRLRTARVSMNTPGLSAVSKAPRNLFYYQAGTGDKGGSFKPNQRKERKLSRRRNTPTNARN